MLRRIGVSLEDDLLEKFDTLIARRGYTNRSEAIRDLIREQLVQKEWSQAKRLGMGVIMIVYDHHTLDLSRRLTEIQHEHFANVVSTLHLHLDHDNCLEISVLKGKTREIQKLGEALISVKGVKYGKLIPTTTGRELS